MTPGDLEPGGAIDAPSPAAERQDLAGRARLAIAWTTGFQLFRDLLQFGLTLVLVRLLSDEAYGQFGFVTTLLSFLTLYSFREFLGHTLQVRDDGQVHYQDHFTAGLVFQTGIFALTNLIAVGLRWIPAYAPVSPVLHVMSLLFLLELFSEFRVKMLERVLDWRRIRLLHGAALVIAAVTSLSLALTGWGVYALLLPTLVVPLPFIYDLLVRARWRPTWQFSWDRFRPSWRFGWVRIAAVSFVSVAAMTESTWLAGALGFALLGVFGRAIGLAQLLCARTAGLLALSVYPVLTRISPQSESFRRAGALYLRTVGWVVVPAAVIASLLAEPLVVTLYSRDWLAVIPLVPWAMAGAALVALVQTAYTLLLASGRQDRCLAADVWRLVGTLAVLAIFLPFGLDKYLLGVALVHAGSFALIAYWLRACDALTARGIGDAVVPPVVSATVAAVAVGLVRAAVGPSGAAVWPAALQATVFAAVYLGCLRLLYRSRLEEIVEYLPEHRRISRWLRLQEAA